MSISKKPAPKKPKGTQQRCGDPVYNLDDFKLVCDVIASRDISLKDACATDPHFMDEVTFWRMMSVNKKAKEMYQDAKFHQTEVKANYIEYMIREQNSTYIDAAGIERTDGAVLRAKIDVIKWSTAIHNPKKFNLKNYAEIVSAQIAEDTSKLVKELNDKNKKDY